MRRLLALFLCLAPAASGHAPEGTDAAIAPWVRSLQQPRTGGLSCCSEADCALARGVKIVDGVYWVTDGDGQRLRVDPGVILRNVNNQAGDYLACIHGGRVLCFVLAPGT